MDQLGSSDARARNLDNRLLVLAVFVGALGIYLYGALRSPYMYADVRFIIGYFTTELFVAAYLLIATAILFPFARLGFQWPRLVNVRHVLPLAVLFLVAVGGWIVARLTLSTDAPFNNETSLLVLRTTVVVGLTEEWIFRGLLLAALSRWLGLCRGAFVALALFGCFHLTNIVVGVPPIAAMIQVGLTALIGSTLLLAAIGTRSLLIPILAHGIYDFAVIDIGQLASAGANTLPSIAVLIAGIIAGIFALIGIARLPQQEPF